MAAGQPGLRDRGDIESTDQTGSQSHAHQVGHGIRAKNWELRKLPRPDAGCPVWLSGSVGQAELSTARAETLRPTASLHRLHRWCRKMKIDLFGKKVP